MSQDDQYSNCICIECALKISTSFNFMQFCFENQKLLRSSHFNVNLLVEATDTPQGSPEQVDLSHLEARIVPTSPVAVDQDSSLTSQTSPLPPPPPLTGTRTAAQQQQRRRRSTPVTEATATPPPHPPALTPVEQPVRVDEPEVDAEDEEGDHPGLALSSMLECQLEEEEEPTSQELPNKPELPPGNPYRCTVCQREFRSKANVLSHFQTQHTNLEVPSAWKYEIEPAKCPLCGDLVECLYAHLEYHAGRRTFKCESCEWAFYSRNYLSIHTTKLHKADAAVDEKPDRFVCKLCPAGSKVCQDYDDLVAHHRQWHLNEMKNKLETCQLCGRETRYMKVHMAKVHNTNSGQFQCHLCDKSYAKARYLQSHVTTAHKDLHLVPHNMPMDFSMGSQNYLQLQQQQQQQPQQPPPANQPKPANAAKRPRPNPGGPVQCVKCQMQFPNNRMLNMHIQRYHNANIHHPVTTTTAEVSVTAIPATADPFHPHLQPPQQEGKAAKKRRRDSVAAAVGPPKDMWNNSALSGMLVNMFGGHAHYED